ncbi:MAG: ATP-binding cassette domain-containing protein [Eubacteriaceae bacterium]|nr:ATP-binding cassette domain-containing protein [Eubacteriaceae bacterium]
MVILEGVNKYFNRKKKNEIHVINDTTLEFGKSGLVGMLGPSGCGKTTLLNVIGGLDKVQKGKIYINGERITGRSAGKIDEIRNLNIGYIFQNYNLVDEMTVFDNVAMVLRMIGVKSKSEINAKVNYALEMVGMYRYRNRFADMLSGGERQRVGIARAIVKNPAIIIADEPTGNLDSKNTLEVMNIIKSISRDKLVILVTHEEKLVDFYASRIIRLRDGEVISDEVNDKADNLDYRVDNKIYLKDMKNHEKIESGDYNIDLYNDTDKKIDVEIVVQNGNIYIKSRDDMDRLEAVDDNSSIELVDSHYREMTQEDFFKHRFEPKKLAPRKMPRYSSIMTPLEMLKSGFKKVAGYKPLKKILLVGFFISAMFIMYSLSNMAGVLNVQDSKFVTVNKDYLKVVDKSVNVTDYLSYESLESVDYLIPGNSKVSFTVPYDEYYQTDQQSGALTGSLTSINNIGKSDLIAGQMPQNKQEVVVDKLAIKKMQEDGTAKMAGLDTAGDFIGKTITVSGMSDFTITGITNKVEPCIYTDPSMFTEIVAGSLSSGQVEEMNMGGMEDEAYSEEGMDDGSGDAEGTLLDYHNYTFSGGVKPTKDYEVVVNESNKDTMPLNKTIDKKVNGQKLKVVGYYSDKDDSTFMLVNSNTLKYNVIEKNSGITVYAKDKDAAREELESLGLNVEDTYAKARSKYVNSNMKSIRAGLITAGVILLISFIEIFLIMRASFMSRVKEVGVFRAIGVKKKDIYKMFLGEIIAITTCAGVPGFVFMSYIVSRLTRIEYLKDNYLIDPGIMAVGLILIFALNIIFGLIPVFRTLRKTPAEILSRTDVD